MWENSIVWAGTFGSDSGVPSSETILRWTAAETALTAGDGTHPRLPSGWGVYSCHPDKFTNCLAIPKPECTDGSCDLVAHLIVSRKINSYVLWYPSLLSSQSSDARCGRG
eukprot:COSAG02_NODE_1245_length_13662_cov_4.594338_3_plen_110_part_00